VPDMTLLRQPFHSPASMPSSNECDRQQRAWSPSRSPTHAVPDDRSGQICDRLVVDIVLAAAVRVAAQRLGAQPVGELGHHPGS